MKVRPQPNNEFFIRLKKKDDTYFSNISIFTNGIETLKFPEKEIAIHPSTTIKGGIKLENIVVLLQEGNPKQLNEVFSLPFQTEVGNYLYDCIFGSWLDRQKGSPIAAHVRIITSDPFLLQLPWILMSDKGIFLTSIRWQISCSTVIPHGTELFKSYPKTIAIFSEPEEFPSTYGKKHLDELKITFESVAADLVSPEKLIIARTWDNLKNALVTDSDLNILYYYGHGQYKDNLSQLIMEDDKANIKMVSFDDLLKLLHDLKSRPQIIYLNCCSGDTAKWLGAGNQLTDMSPVVITNRTTAFIDSSRQIAISFFNQILSKGENPVNALTYAANTFSREKNIRSFTPVCYYTCQQWKGEPTNADGGKIHSPDWYITLNRENQVDKSIGRIADMLSKGIPRSMGMIWYGTPNQGVETFHERINLELTEKFRDVMLKKVNIEWPAIIENLGRSFQEHFCHILGVDKMDCIKNGIVKMLPHVGEKTRIIIFHHKPIDLTKESRIKPSTIKTYLSWWSGQMLRFLPNDIFSLLGISFIVPEEKLDRFLKLMKKEILVNFLDEDFRSLLLDQFKGLNEEDLITFFVSHRLMPKDKMNIVSHNIIKTYEGKFDEILVIMKSIPENWFQFIEASIKNDVLDKF